MTEEISNQDAAERGGNPQPEGLELQRRILLLVRERDDALARALQSEAEREVLRGQVETLSRKAESALEQSRKRFQDLVETVNDWVWEVDPKGSYTYASPQVQNLLGYEPEEVVGKTPFDFMPEDEAERVRMEFRRIVAQGEPFSVLENTNRHKDGHLVILETSGVSFFDKKGTLLGYRGIDRDITERKHLEAHLTKAKQAAEEANQAKNLFLAHMSHELRTPLTVLMGTLDFLKDGGDADLQSKLLEMASGSAQRLLGIIDDLLDISRIEAHRLKIEEKPFDLRPCVRKAVEMFATAARAKGLDLTVRVDRLLPAEVRGDPDRLGQVLVNLVGNAVKFSQRGEVEVTVEGTGELLFSVRDTGIGIPADKMGALFKPFSQVDDSITRRYGGTGLGLAISKELVEMMGGSIAAKSEVGRGSVFSFSLPLRPALSREEPALPGFAREEGRALQVLLAEDEPMAGDLMRMTLARMGMNVVSVENGRQAVDRWKQGGIDLVLMDLQMPELDGLEATRRIRESEDQQGRRTCIFALTAHVRQEDREKCLAAGLDGFLAKPLQIEELDALIMNCPCDLFPE
jgi:PAS domain S-box-containing protein